MCLAIVVDLETKVSILLSKGHADFMAGIGIVVLIDFALPCVLPTRDLGSPLLGLRTRLLLSCPRPSLPSCHARRRRVGCWWEHAEAQKKKKIYPLQHFQHVVEEA